MANTPEQSDDFRRGDEPHDATLDGFKVFAGNPSDRQRLQEEDPVLLDELSTDLNSILGRYATETNRDKD